MDLTFIVNSLGLGGFIVYVSYKLFDKITNKSMLTFLFKRPNLRKLTSSQCSSLANNVILIDLEQHISVAIPNTLRAYLRENSHKKNERTATVLCIVFQLQFIIFKEGIETQLARVKQHKQAEKDVVVNNVAKALNSISVICFETFVDLKIPEEVIMEFLTTFGYQYEKIKSNVKINLLRSESYFAEIDKLLSIASTFMEVLLGLLEAHINYFNGNISTKLTDEVYNKILNSIEELKETNKSRYYYLTKLLCNY